MCQNFEIAPKKVQRARLSQTHFRHCLKNISLVRICAPFPCFWNQSDLPSLTIKVSLAMVKFDDGSTVASALADTEFDEFCHRIQDNDDTVEWVTLGDPGINDIKAVTLGQSLVANTRVSKITIDFNYIDKFCGSIFCFLEFIEKSGALDTIELKNSELTNTKVCSTLLVLLPAISKNPNVKNFMMQNREATYFDLLTAFWQTLASALKTLFGGSYGSTTRMMQTAVVVSFCQCQKLEELKFERLPEGFICQILPDLHRVEAMKKLSLRPKRYSVSTFLALQAVLTTSKSLEHLNLQGFRLTANRFNPVVTGVSSSASVNTLSISECHFNRSSTKLFEGLFKTKTSTIRTLIIGKNVTFAVRSIGVVLYNIVFNSQCSLTSLDVSACSLGKDIAGILSNLEEKATVDESGVDIGEKKALEVIRFGIITSDGELEALKTYVPNLQDLKEISVELSPKLLKDIDELMDAFKCNSGLRKFTINQVTTVLKEEGKPKRRYFDETGALQRKNSLKNILSPEEIEQINAKDKFLQLERDPSSSDVLESSNANEEESTTANAGASTEETTDSGISDALKRHGLGSNVRKLLGKEESETTDSDLMEI